MSEEKITGYGKLKRWISRRIRISLHNIFVGEDSGKIATGNDNVFMGYRSGYNNTTGATNSFIGCQAGYSNISGVQNVSIGAKAGYYETGHNKLYIDNTPRANEVDGRIKALIYGVFDPATANQRIRVNGRLLIRECPAFDDDAAAGAAGLETGELYQRPADGFVRIKA